MAFTSPCTHNGYTYPNAYYKATIARMDASHVVIRLEIYPDAACRKDGYAYLTEQLQVLPSDLDNWSVNPIEGCYSKLQASGIYPDATWNV